MYNTEYTLVGNAAEKKLAFYQKNKGAYFVSSMLGGFYIGICMVTIVVMAGFLPGFGGIKILQGISFVAGMSLVVFAGAELFTGNVFVMTAGTLLKVIKPRNAIQVCVYSYLGNLAGSMLIGALFWGTGYLQGYIQDAAQAAMYGKTNPLFMQILWRAVLCNILVCASIWCSYKTKSDAAKLIMIFWCIFLFIFNSFEHSIANMTLFSMEIFAAYSLVSIKGVLLNLAAATVGNTIGGMVLALSYGILAKKS